MTIRRPRVFAAGVALIALAVAVAYMSVTRTITIEPPLPPASSHETGGQPPDVTVSFGTEVTEEAIHVHLGIPLILAIAGVVFIVSGVAPRRR